MKKNKNPDPFAAREAATYDNPIPSREYISKVLSDSSGPMDYKSLCKLLQISDEEQKEALRRRLRAMVRDGQLIANRKGEYGLADKMDLVRGRVQGHRDGYGFVMPFEGGDDIYLQNRQMRKVFDGDEVLVVPEKPDARGRREGRIVEVLKRNTTSLVGRYFCEAGNHFVRPDNPRNNLDILVAPEHLGDAQAGQFVVVEILQQPDRRHRPSGRIVEVLGNHLAPGMEIDIAIRSHGIPHVWPDAVRQQAQKFPDTVPEQDKTHRIDLRHLPFVTIDGEDARDFDDAVYCEKKRSGGWRLFVAIADVAHYVTPGSALDVEALQRGNSVYFPNHVVPMLPESLSNGLCSLNPKVDRLCMVCEMTISAAGGISAYWFYESIIHSQARMTYTQVGQIISDRSKKQSSIRKQYQSLLPRFDELYRLYLALRASREARGAIDFETQETRILFDSQRKIQKIVPLERNDAHKLIEECMLAANVCTARFLEHHKIDSLYRVHEGPSAEKLEMLTEYLRELGLHLKSTGRTRPADFSELLNAITGRPDAHLIQTVMLRSMNQARYQSDNIGHFGLAYPAYAHFTSPIRRYPDLVVHRAIRSIIHSTTQSTKVKRHDKTKRIARNKTYPYQPADMFSIGEQCSQTERRADEATRDVISWLKCEYLQDRVGDEFDGVISSVTAFGLFIELNELYIEGLLHITALPHDYYHHEAAHHRLIGERTRRKFCLGDQIRVRVVRVNLDERKIDFDFISAKNRRRKAASNSVAKKEVLTPARQVRKRAVKAESPEQKPIDKVGKESKKSKKKLKNGDSKNIKSTGKKKKNKKGRKPDK